MKNKYYDRKVRESWEIDMAVVRYGQDKVLNRHNVNFVKTSCMETAVQKNENTALKFDVILY